MPDNKIILAGGSGFLGQALARHFQTLGWEVITLTRKPSAAARGREIIWDGQTVGPWATELEGAKVVINLCGKSVDCRYTAANKRELIDSRVHPTRTLGRAISACKIPPATWINCSSATIYRHTLDEPWDESGTDFSPTAEVKDAFSLEIIHAWEKELAMAETPSTRKLALRTTMVLGEGKNSVFPVLCRLARMGLGGKLGSGKQYVSWLHEIDLCRAVEWLIDHEEVSGPVNLAAPHPLTNAEMMRLFRQAVGMPVGLPAATWMLEVGAFFLRTETELILKSRRVIPGKLLSRGFHFQFPTFAEAVADLMAATSK
jgi:hypothetical protein